MLFAFDYGLEKVLCFKVTTYLARLHLISICTNYLNLIAQLLDDLKGKLILVSECIVYYTLAVSSLVWTHQHV